MDNQNAKPLPLPTIRRYPIFLRAIGEMMDAGEAYISSSVLAERLGDAACVHNYGVSGRTVSKEGDRPYTETDAYRESLAYEPDIVVLALGSNDSKPFNWDLQSFTEGFNELIYAYKSLPSEPVVIVVLPPPVFEVNGKVAYSIDKDVLENEIVPAVEAIAEHYRLQVQTYADALQRIYQQPVKKALLYFFHLNRFISVIG